MSERRSNFEVSSSGIDERLQGLGGDAYDTLVSTGLRVPTLATPLGPNNRYSFMLCGFQLAENVKANIVGWRTWQTIFGKVGSYPVPIELTVTDPAFAFPDGNVSYHLRKLSLRVLENYRFGQIPITLPTGAPAPNVQNFSWRIAQSPALLYELGTMLTLSGFYVDLTTYVPPFGGRIPGEPVFDLPTIHDPRAPWMTANAWGSLDIPVDGPGFYAMFASVRQTAGTVLPPGTSPAGLPPEWAFIAAAGINPVRYCRVGGAFDVAIHKESSQKGGAPRLFEKCESIRDGNSKIVRVST